MSTNIDIQSVTPVATSTFAPSAASAIAFEQSKAEIETAARGEVTPVNADMLFAVRVLLSICGNIRKFLPGLETLAVQGGVNVAAITSLERRTQALSYAHALHAWTLKGPGPIDDLVEEVTEARRVLLSELGLMQARKLIAKDAVTIQSTTGRLAIAQDVRAMCSAFLASWTTVGPQIGNDIAHVDAAMAAADKLVAAIAHEEEFEQKLKGTLLIRAAAWTLVIESYREVQRWISFIRYYQGDAAKIVPALFDHSGRRKSKDADEDDADGDTDPVVDPLKPIIASNGTPGTPATPAAPILPQKAFDE